nr:hypothetical protein [Tanacetum cinerariifolium]
MWDELAKQFNKAEIEKIKNGNSFVPVTQTTTAEGGVITTTISSHVTAEEKIKKKNDVKARSMLLMALPNEHLMTFNQFKDAKSLFAAIETRFGGNKATRKTRKTLLKQMYENFSASSTDLPSEWNTHVVVWRNKPDLDTMSIDDLYNNFKIVEQEVKVTASSNSSSQNMAFVTSPSTNNTNKVHTAYGLVHEDLEQIHKDDLEGIDLKWQLALLSIRAKRYFQDTGKKITINGSDIVGFDKSKVECYNCHKMRHFARERRGPRNQDSRKRYQDSSRRTVHVEETPPKAMVAIDGVGFDWSYMAEDEDKVSDNKDCSVESPVVVEKKTVVPTIAKVKVVRPKQQEKPVKKIVRYAEMYKSQGPKGNKRNWSNLKSQQLGSFKEFNGGYVTFGRGANGGKITDKGTIKTNNLDFKDVYFVKELKFNLFSVSQMCDRKNNVLFTDTKCLVLSPYFKLPDESHILLRVPRKNNMYSVDMKNIVPKESLTCLVAKAILDESMLWHRRPSHINFINNNKLFKDKLVRATKDETTSILKKFITEIEKLIDKKVKLIRCDNGTEFKNSVMNDFCAMKGKFNRKSYEGYFVGYSVNSKAFRIYNIRTRRVEENLHIEFLENKPIVAGFGPEWLFDIDMLTNSINCVPVFAGTNFNDFADGSPLFDSFLKISDDAGSPLSGDDGMKHDAVLDKESGPSNELNYDFENLSTEYPDACPTPTTRIHKNHPPKQEELLQFKLQKIWILVDLPKGKKAIAKYLLGNGIHRGKIDQTLFIKRKKGDILLVHVYVDDIIFSSTKKELCIEFERLMKDKFQMSFIGELTFFLGLQLKQKKDGIFISQDKYVTDVLRKFNFSDVKSASTPVDTEKTLVKDADGDDVDVYIYRSMIKSLMYLTTSRPDIIDYAGASLDIKSTTRGCQFLGSRLISWQCKKQNVVATSTTEAEYVAAASCCG